MAIYTYLFGWLPPILISLLPILLSLIYKLKNKGVRPNLPPSPPSLPVVGHLHHLGDVTHRSLWLLSKKYGPLMYLKLGRVPTVVASSAKMAREIMKYHDQECSSRPAYISWVKYSYNQEDIAFRPYDAYWKEMRKICFHEIFNIKRVQSFGYIREEEVARLVESISLSSSHSSEPVNVSKELLSFFYNVICRIIFRRSYEEKEGYKGKIDGIMEEGRNLMGGLFVADYLPWMWLLDVVTGIHGRLNRNFHQYDAFYDQIIENHLDPKRQKPEKEDFLDVLLQLQKDTNLGRDNIKAILMNLLLGGSDTSAAIASWGMLELVRNPRVMKKVQEEVRRVAGKKGKVEETDLQELTYLKAVVKESLRLHPSGPLLVPRETIQHFKIDGYDILPKTRVLVNAWAVMRDPEIWQDPEEFIPERFIDSSIDYKDFEFIPFGAGRRGCPGANFASVTMQISLANILYLFNWELPAGMEIEDVDITEKPGLTVIPKHPLILVPIKYNYI